MVTSKRNFARLLRLQYIQTMGILHFDYVLRLNDVKQSKDTEFDTTRHDLHRKSTP